MIVNKIFVMLLLAYVLTQNIYAKSCLNDLNDNSVFSLEEAYNKTNLIFIGSVIEKESVILQSKDVTNFEVSSKVIFKVEKYFKNNISGESKTINIHSKAGLKCECYYDFKYGESYLVYADESELSNEYILHLCGHIKVSGSMGDTREKLNALKNSKKTE